MDYERVTENPAKQLFVMASKILDKHGLKKTFCNTDFLDEDDSVNLNPGILVVAKNNKCTVMVDNTTIAKDVDSSKALALFIMYVKVVGIPQKLVGILKKLAQL